MKKLAVLISLLVLLTVACGSGKEETERIVRVRVQVMEPSSISSEVYANT